VNDLAPAARRHLIATCSRTFARDADASSDRSAHASCPSLKSLDRGARRVQSATPDLARTHDAVALIGVHRCFASARGQVAARMPRSATIARAVYRDVRWREREGVEAAHRA